MSEHGNEEDQVRAVALLNANSIQVARLRAEHDLRKQTQWLRVTLASIGDAVISTDAEGNVTFLNPVAEGLTGWTMADAVGHPLPEIFRIIGEETRQRAANPALRALQEGTIVGLANHTILIAKDGSEVYIDDSAAPIRNEAGASIGSVLVFRDVSERKRGEDALRESEARHRFLAELAAATQSFSEPDSVMTVASGMLAENMKVDRCAYAEIEDETVFVITGDHARGVPSIVGRWPVSSFGSECMRCMLANEPFVVDDVDSDDRIANLDLAAYRATQIQAVICVPLQKDGRFTAAMAVHQKTPRHWTTNEVALVRTVVAQCWEALERARVGRTLKESEARYRAIVEASPECVKLVDSDGTLLQMNPAGLAMIEGDKSAVGQCVYDVVAPEFRNAFQTLNERVCRGDGGTLAFEIIGLQGTRRHMETTAVPLPAPGGGFYQLAVTRDVTQRAAADRALAETRARLEYAAQVSGIGFWYCDLPFDELTWDDRVKEHFWLPPDARVTIDTFFNSLHPDDREPTRAAIETSLRERAPYDIDFRTVHPVSGAVKWIRALGGPSCGPSGVPVRFDGASVDVTARKLEADRLARLLERETEQARLLRMVADAALTIHSAGSLESVLRVATEEARRVIGAGHAVGSVTLGGDLTQGMNVVSLAEKDQQRYRDILWLVEQGFYAALCDEPGPVRMTQTEVEACPEWRNFVEQNGLMPPIRGWLAAPFISRGGARLGWVRLSDKHGSEFSENDEVILIQLAHIASVAIENARLYEELRQQDRRKDEFLAILAHELRNPLAPLRNGLEVMRLIGEPSEDAAMAREMMDRQLSHMVRIIDDLLDISRISRNKMELRRSRVLLTDVISSAIETVRPILESAGHELNISLPSEPLYMDADLTRLAQVFANLLSNSAKYTNAPGHIWLTANDRGNHLVVTVRDTGIGIPKDALATVFDMFSQVDRSNERATGGMGIGLALVKGLTEMHGGTVEVTSPGPGKGSTFTVRVPIVSQHPRSSPMSTHHNEPSKAAPTQRILIVDDNRDAAVTMAMTLKLLGNEVHTAHDGLAAVEAAAQHRPNIIFMDIGMPKLNGYEATRRIREQSWGQSMIIIALTGWGQETDRTQAREAGCNGHLVKPVDLKELHRLLVEKDSSAEPSDNGRLL